MVGRCQDCCSHGLGWGAYVACGRGRVGSGGLSLMSVCGHTRPDSEYVNACLDPRRPQLTHYVLHYICACMSCTVTLSLTLTLGGVMPLDTISITYACEHIRKSLLNCKHVVLYGTHNNRGHPFQSPLWKLDKRRTDVS